MKRPIKFRGRVPDTDKLDGGRIVYGSLVDYGEDDGLYRYWIHPIGGGGRNYFPVDENSIAQLVGYDKDGHEVYEGDTVVSEYGFSVTAWLVDNLPPKPKLKELQQWITEAPIKTAKNISLRFAANT